MWAETRKIPDVVTCQHFSFDNGNSIKNVEHKVADNNNFSEPSKPQKPFEIGD